ncbi:MAG: DTW domain-containing protein, partial [Comamonas sp.]
MSNQPSARPRCPQCLRALRSCICALAKAVEHQTQLLILMHPQEVHEAKGTGHLLHLCLPYSQVLVGEQLDTATLQQALHGDGRHSLLLYPETNEQDAALGLVAAAPLPSPWPCSSSALRLVVIDG